MVAGICIVSKDELHLCIFKLAHFDMKISFCFFQATIFVKHFNSCKKCGKTSVADPDPHGSAFKKSSRIRIQEVKSLENEQFH